jgi:starch synthase
MKICYVANYIQIPYYGGKGSGGTTHTYEVAKGLVERGHVVHLLCSIGLGQAKSEDIDGISVKRIFKDPGKLYYILKDNMLIWVFLKWPYHLFKHFRESTILVLFLLRNKCDIVYERSSLGTKIHSLIYLIFGISLVVEVNDYRDRISSLVAKFIITPNKSVIFPWCRKKVKELPWGANIKIFRPGLMTSELKHKYAVGDKKIVLIVCSGIPWHGLDELIEAVRIIVPKRNDIVFMVVGGGPHFQEYEQKVSFFGLGNKFIFAGVVDYPKVPEFVNMADIAVAPYNSVLHSAGRQRELFASPLKVFEYMACAKPVIITDIANKNNIIEHMQTGIVVKTDSPKDLAGAILDLCNNEPLCFKLGMNARNVVEKRFSWESHIQELEKTFIAAKRNGR